METHKVFIYTPTTEKGSIYYGNNTKWCTASKSKNMFDYYNKIGPLYIIQSKNNVLDKYQIHFETRSIMNDKDEPVSLNYIWKNFNDKILNEWLGCKIKKVFINEAEYPNVFLDNEILSLIGKINIKNLIINNISNLPFNNRGVEKITFGESFNKRLGNFLDNFIIVSLF